MIICFNCSPETKESLDKLVKTGQYKDYAEAISFAVMNLAVLQNEILKKGALVIGSDIQSEEQGPFVQGSPEPEIGRVATQPTFEAQKSKETEMSIRTVTKDIVVPELFLLNGIDKTLPAFAPLPFDVWTSGATVPLDRWLFGQYNKLLPAKANCRALAHMLVDQPKGVSISMAAHKIAAAAVALGEFLVMQDKANDIGRDDSLSTAFPISEDNLQKGLLRYTNQFIANVNKNGQVSGLLIDLKLINYTRKKDARLLLTEAGWRFATLSNPVLDGTSETPIQKLSSEERIFLLKHISCSVPAEDFAYRAILKAISEGANTPDTIDAVLQSHVLEETRRNLSKSFLSSQRSGAISRMADLGLVERVRDGVRVSYVVTDIGKQYAEGLLELSAKE